MEFFLLFVLKNDGSIVAILFCFVYHLFRFTSYHSKNKSKEIEFNEKKADFCHVFLPSPKYRIYFPTVNIGFF